MYQNDQVQKRINKNLIERKFILTITTKKIVQLNGQYQSDKQVLQGYYLDFMIAGDTEGMESIKGELTAFATQYNNYIEEVKNNGV